MIGGRVLDAGVISAFATGTSLYAQALVWTAVEVDVVLVLPSCAVATAWAHLVEPATHPVLDVLLSLHVTLVDDLTRDRARAVGLLGGRLPEAHAVLCATDRGWPLVTADVGRYRRMRLGSVELEALA